MKSKGLDKLSALMLGRRIKQLRGDLTQTQFAEKLGITYQYLGAWENGRKVPGGKYLTKIAEETGCNMNWLLSGEGEPYITEEQRPDQIAEQQGVYFTGLKVPIVSTAQANPNGSLEPELIENEWAEFREGLISMKVIDESMAPIAWPGQIVLCDPDAAILDGDLVVVKVKYHGLLFKRVRFDKKRNLVLLESVNAARNERAFIVAPDEVEYRYKVVGVLFE